MTDCIPTNAAAGECPICRGNDLDYDVFSMEEGWGYYPWRCANCGAEGKEDYELKFAEQNVWCDEERALW